MGGLSTCDGEPSLAEDVGDEASRGGVEGLEPEDVLQGLPDLCDVRALVRAATEGSRGCLIVIAIVIVVVGLQMSRHRNRLSSLEQDTVR